MLRLLVLSLVLAACCTPSISSSNASPAASPSNQPTPTPTGPLGQIVGDVLNAKGNPVDYLPTYVPGYRRTNLNTVGSTDAQAYYIDSDNPDPYMDVLVTVYPSASRASEVVKETAQRYEALTGAHTAATTVAGKSGLLAVESSRAIGFIFSMGTAVVDLRATFFQTPVTDSSIPVLVERLKSFADGYVPQLPP